MDNLIQFNTAILTVGQHVIISGMSQDLWYFEHNAVIKDLASNKLIVTYQDRLTQQHIDYPITIQDVIEGRTSIKCLPNKVSLKY